MVKDWRPRTRPILRLLLIATICLVASSSLWGQAIEIDVPPSVEQGKRFRVVYAVESEQVQLTRGPELTGLELLYGPVEGYSQSTVITNGRMVQKSYSTYTYTLVALGSGTAKLSPIVLLVDGKEVKSKGVNIKVLPPETAASSDAHFMYQVSTPNRSTYYEQEAIPVSYRFYGSRGYEFYREVKALEFEGFLSLDLRDNQSVTQLVHEQIKGRNYLMAELNKLLLYPQRTGELTIPSHGILFRTPKPPTPSDPFGSLETRQIASQEQKIKVVPLPSEGRPEDFTGAVGQFTLSSQVNTKTPRTGEILAIKLIIEGSGNLKIAQMPRPSFDRAFENYDPEDQYEFQIDGGKLREQRTITYTLIPRKVGEYIIPPIKFSYFDPSSGRYITRSGEGYRIEVAQGKETQQTVISTGTDAASGVSAIALPLDREEGSRVWAGEILLRLMIYPLLYLVLALLGYVVYLLLRRRDAFRADGARYHASRANAVALKRLRRAKQLLDVGSEESFYQELLAALWGYLGDKLQLPLSELNRESIAQILSARGVPEETIAACTEVLDMVEFARFAPGSATDKMQEAYAHATEAIASIEDYKFTL